MLSSDGIDNSGGESGQNYQSHVSVECAWPKTYIDDKFEGYLQI